MPQNLYSCGLGAECIYVWRIDNVLVEHFEKYFIQTLNILFTLKVLQLGMFHNAGNTQYK